VFSLYRRSQDAGDERHEKDHGTAIEESHEPAKSIESAGAESFLAFPRDFRSLKGPDQPLRSAIGKVELM
jgi:hypothetical protein